MFFKQVLLPTCKLDTGHGRITRTPRLLGRTVLEQQRPALVIGDPRGGSVSQGLREYHDRARIDMRSENAARLFVASENLRRTRIVGFVASRQ